MGKQKICIKVNGADMEADVESRLLLVHCIRDVFGLTGLISDAIPLTAELARSIWTESRSSHALCLRSKRMGVRSRPSKDWNRMASSIRFKRDSGKNMGCSAAFARRA